MALALCLRRLMHMRLCPGLPLRQAVAAVSVGGSTARCVWICLTRKTRAAVDMEYRHGAAGRWTGGCAAEATTSKSGTVQGPTAWDASRCPGGSATHVDSAGSCSRFRIRRLRGLAHPAQ